MTLVWLNVLALGAWLGTLQYTRGDFLPLSLGEALALWVWLVTFGALAWVRAYLGE